MGPFSAGPLNRRVSTLRGLSAGVIFFLPLVCGTAFAQVFQLPTANHALFEPGQEENYFVPTVGKTWSSGTFGCVRSGGWQMHEGLDIRPLTHDRKGEPADAILATADGTVVYVSSRPALSNYGNYLVIRHQVGGMEIYSLYAHLAEIRAGLQAGQSVKAGETIARMGRTANTREGISKERGHLHFELDLMVNDNFAQWYRGTFPDQRNDHGNWNGQNFLGVDPRQILLEQRHQGAGFSLLKHLQSQPELCRVLVRKTNFPWLRRYPALVAPNPIAQKEGIAGYELALNFNGLPISIVPLAASEIKSKGKVVLLSVNEAEYKKNPGCRLVAKTGSRWALARNGANLVSLLTY